MLVEWNVKRKNHQKRGETKKIDGVGVRDGSLAGGRYKSVFRLNNNSNMAFHKEILEFLLRVFFAFSFFCFLH
jgi:hypothetical protein